jgi:hypothetical protein
MDLAADTRRIDDRERSVHRLGDRGRPALLVDERRVRPAMQSDRLGQPLGGLASIGLELGGDERLCIGG